MAPCMLACAPAKANGALLNSELCELFNSARHYADSFGWEIIPIGTDKRPTRRVRRLVAGIDTKDWRLPASNWSDFFEDDDVTGIAVILGDASEGLVCRDFDIADDYSFWAESQPALASLLPTVKTRRGYHVYFKSRDIRRKEKYYHGEVPAGELIANGYALLPPSRHPEGIRYRWLVEPERPIPCIDDPIAVQLVRPDLTKRAPTPPPSDISNLRFLPCTGESEGTARASVHARVHAGKGRKAPSPVPAHYAKMVEVETKLALAFQPDRVGVRNTCIRELAAILKAYNRNKDPEKLKNVFHQWWRTARAVVGTKNFEISWREFLACYRGCKGTPFSWDEVRSIAAGVKLPSAASGYDVRGRQLVRLCVALQRRWDAIAPGLPFFLSARTAGKEIGLASSDAAHKRLQKLERAAILERVKTGVSYPGGQPTLWRCLV